MRVDSRLFTPRAGKCPHGNRDSLQRPSVSNRFFRWTHCWGIKGDGKQCKQSQNPQEGGQGEHSSALFVLGADRPQARFWAPSALEPSRSYSPFPTSNLRHLAAVSVNMVAPAGFWRNGGPKREGGRSSVLGAALPPDVPLCKSPGLCTSDL